MSTKQYPLILEVARVGRGGNTGGGEYFYSYGPDIVLVEDEGPVELVLQLSEDTAPHFRFIDMLSTDSQEQLGEPQISEDGRSMRVANSNSCRQVIIMNILVSDTSRSNRTVVCDPQVINRPK